MLQQQLRRHHKDPHDKAEGMCVCHMASRHHKSFHSSIQIDSSYLNIVVMLSPSHRNNFAVDPYVYKEDKDQRGISDRTGEDTVWGKSSVGRMFVHKNVGANQELASDPIPSHTSSYMRRAAPPVADYTRDTATASQWGVVHLEPGLAVLQNLHSWTTS